MVVFSIVVFVFRGGGLVSKICQWKAIHPAITCIYQLCIIQLLPLSMLEAHRTYQSSLWTHAKLRYPLITQLSDAVPIFESWTGSTSWTTHLYLGTTARNKNLCIGQSWRSKNPSISFKWTHQHHSTQTVKLPLSVANVCIRGAGSVCFIIMLLVVFWDMERPNLSILDPKKWI